MSYSRHDSQTWRATVISYDLIKAGFFEFSSKPGFFVLLNREKLMIKSINEAFLEGKRVLTRLDLNVPLDANHNITDDNRILASKKTIDRIIEIGGLPVLMSHLGRPKGERKTEYSLRPVANYLSDKLGYDVVFLEDCIGEEVEKATRNLKHGQIALLENLRFHPEETKNEREFSKKLALNGDVYVNDAFGTAHRAHASTVGVTEFFESRYAGFLMTKELENLGTALKNPERPFTAVIGGAKISGKIDVIKNLFDKCDKILIGGGMMFTFYKAMGYEIGNSILEEDKVSLAGDLLEEAKKRSIRLELPTDVVVAKEFKNDAEHKVVSATEIQSGWIGMDIGDVTKAKFAAIIKDSKTTIWNGPMGVFEMETFSKGTYAIAEAMAKATDLGAKTIVGGGDSAAAVIQMDFADKVTHVSTGGGASLEYLEGKTLPGVAALEV